MNTAKAGQVGVTCHLLNPTLDEAAALARESEAAGADWLGLPDAFWWRDTWLLVGAALEATERILDRSDGDEPIPPPSLPDRGRGRDRAGPIRRPGAPRARGGWL